MGLLRFFPNQPFIAFSRFVLVVEISLGITLSGCGPSVTQVPDSQPTPLQAKALPATWTATLEPSTKPTNSPEPQRATVTATEPAASIQQTVTSPTIYSLPISEWTRYDSERNPISFDHPSSLTVMEEAGVVQFGNGDVNLTGGTIYIAVTMFHFYELDSPYLPAGVDVTDLVRSLQAMVDFYFMGWEDEVSIFSDPQLRIIGGYPAAEMTVRRQTDQDKRTGFPVDSVYLFCVVLREDQVVRVQMMSHWETGGHLLPVYGERLLDSVRFD